MKTPARSHSFDLIFVMTLMCAFIIISLLLVGFGSNLYKNTVDAAETDYQLRTSLSYVCNKLSHDAACERSVETVGGVEALLVREDIGGRSYTTYIYFYDGSLREQFTETANGLDPSAGIAILDLAAFDISTFGNLVSFTATARDGLRRSVTARLDRT